MFKNINILKIYFENPTQEFSVREIAKLAKISPATASKIIKEINQKEIISLKEERGTYLSKANIENDYYKDMKTYYNIRKLKDTKFLEEINKCYLHPTILLFGSYSKGMDTETSDIDILIISEKEKDFPKKEFFEKKLNKELQIFCVSGISSIKNKELLNNMFNGTILQGIVKWTSKNV